VADGGVDGRHDVGWFALVVPAQVDPGDAGIEELEAGEEVGEIDGVAEDVGLGEVAIRGP
jgi:hypothetical protein